MIIDCTKCKHFKPVTSVVAEISNRISNSDENVARKYSQIIAEELSHRDVEIEIKCQYIKSNIFYWEKRPKFANCCNKLIEGKHPIPEVKNADKQCSDFQAIEPVIKTCETCIHMVRSDQEMKDRKRIEDAGRLESMVQRGGNLLQKLEAKISSNKSMEIDKVFRSDRTVDKPTYMNFCKRSAEILETGSSFNYIICSIYNIEKTCDLWQK